MANKSFVIAIRGNKKGIYVCTLAVDMLVFRFQSCRYEAVVQGVKISFE